MAASAALFLQAAGTVELVYTVRPSFVLMSVAVVLGLPFAVDGWRRTPPWISWPAAGLLAAYLICLLFGRSETIGLARAGSHRDLVYIGDLLVGLGAFGLVVALWAGERRMRGLLGAVVLSGAVAAAYAVYQWPAQIFHWPLNDVINVPDSNAVTTGGSQGAGVFGHERVRGTFLEPHLLGAFLASVLPVTLALWPAATHATRRALLCALVVLMLLALLFTSSVPAWAILLICALATLFAVALAKRWRVAVRSTLALLVVVLAMVPLFIAYPDLLSGLTGRSTADLALTTDFRTQTWETVLEIWADRPAIGYGPGQSSVQLTMKEGDDAPGLLSAHGIWAAALIDSGVLGLAFWLAFLGGVLGVGTRCLLRRPSLLRAATATAALAAFLSTLIAGDRLDLRVWILLAAFTAVSLPPPALPVDPSE